VGASINGGPNNAAACIGAIGGERQYSARLAGAADGPTHGESRGGRKSAKSAAEGVLAKPFRSSRPDVRIGSRWPVPPYWAAMELMSAKGPALNNVGVRSSAGSRNVAHAATIDQVELAGFSSGE